jgi:hypothetical protein
MSVTARMFCQRIILAAHSPLAKTIELSVVSRGPENKEWAAATPTGNMTLTINNGDAAEQFDIGKDYLITITPVPDGKQHTGAYGE